MMEVQATCAEAAQETINHLKAADVPAYPGNEYGGFIVMADTLSRQDMRVITWTAEKYGLNVWIKSVDTGFVGMYIEDIAPEAEALEILDRVRGLISKRRAQRAKKSTIAPEVAIKNASTGRRLYFGFADLDEWGFWNSL